jgi:hypothetical protein
MSNSFRSNSGYNKNEQTSIIALKGERVPFFFFLFLASQIEQPFITGDAVL